MWEEWKPEYSGQRREAGHRQRQAAGNRTADVRSVKRRKRNRHVFLKIGLCLILLLAASRILPLGMDLASGEGKLALLSLTDARAGEILKNREQYPEELLDLLKSNEETLDFVLDYPEKKDAPPAESIGDVEQGRIPLLLQWDERWGYGIYGDDMIALNGCGPTVIAMVAAGLTGDDTVTPYKVAQFAAENGYYAGDSGTSWSLMTEGARQFGIYGEELGLSADAVFSALEAGHPVVCSMSPGDFTTTGHFIVLTGIEDGRIRVNDPNSRKRSEKLWDYDRLEPQIRNLWVFTAG